MNTAMTSAVLVFLVLGLILGLILAYASERFHVPIDPKLDAVISALPQANCGACGYPGCAGCGTAIYEGKAPVTACPVGGAPTAIMVADIMGISSDASAIPQVARVKCNGTATTTKMVYEYSGANSCLLAKNSFSGMKACNYGCFGLGTCAVSCPFDAIEMVNGLPKVHMNKCTACGICVKACPQFLMELVPQVQEVLVNCNNLEKGKAVMDGCSVACIKCKKCERACNDDAIHVDLVAAIDYSKCTNCGACEAVCPTHAITMRNKQTHIDRDILLANAAKSCDGCNEIRVE